MSQRGIADTLGCSRNTVAAVFAAATTAGVGFGEVAELGADEVRRLLLPDPSAPVSDRAAPDFEYVHRELGRPSVTLLLLWNEYVARCRQSGEVPYQYSFFNEQYRRWAKATMTSLAEWLAQARQRLSHTADQPALEAQVLLAHVLQKPRPWVIA